MAEAKKSSKALWIVLGIIFLITAIIIVVWYKNRKFLNTQPAPFNPATDIKPASAAQVETTVKIDPNDPNAIVQH